MINCFYCSFVVTVESIIFESVKGSFITPYVLLAAVLLSSGADAQEGGAGTFFTSPLSSNPAYTGTSGNNLITLSYAALYPGYNMGTATIYGSWDSWFESLHGGAGLYVLENRLGDILNDLRIGGTYAYHLQADRNLWINAGFTASMIHRSLNSSAVILPDQIDPLLGPVLPSGESVEGRSRTLFDASVGFIVRWYDFTGGLSISHIATPDLTGDAKSFSRLPRRYSIHGSYIFTFQRNRYGLEPVFAASYQGSAGYLLGGLVGRYDAFSVNLASHFSFPEGLSAFQAGVAVEAGAVEVGYNHLFTAGNQRVATPKTFSSVIVLRLTIPEGGKSAPQRAINYPKL
ncbi:MAG: PorP/SprF family type IX secretion system membrane protein [Bacteroidales bacterium]|nr:PorP/SprF family type IX secretion system membrane protein [Bacteroidales bacterium]